MNSQNRRKFTQVPLRLVLIVPFVLQVVGAVGLVGYLSYRSGQAGRFHSPKLPLSEPFDHQYLGLFLILINQKL